MKFIPRINIKSSLFLLIAMSCFFANANINNDYRNVVSFNKAKKNLYTKVFNNSGNTIYCGCEWRNKKVDLKSCNLQSYFPKKQLKRALRTEAEHIIPASWMLSVNKKPRQCALDSKKHKLSARNYCLKNDLNYKMAHNDLVNLYPASGQINANRSNKPFVDVVRNKVNSYGQCDVTIGSRGIAPPENKKGDIARVAMYMHSRYGVVYSKRQRDLFIKWNKLDPVSKEEIQHNNRIVAIQGYGIEF